MPNYRENGSQPSPFQNGPDQQDRRTTHDGSAPHTPHDQLVTHFRRFIAKEQEKHRRHSWNSSPVEIVRYKLEHESGPAHTDPHTRSQAFDFWYPLILAWDALAYDRYDPNSFQQFTATSRLSDREPVIQLNRYQAGIIDALTEAAGIPHQKGQTEIAIPESVKANSKAVREQMHDAWLQMFGVTPRKR